jgi:hypothetical protein
MEAFRRKDGNKIDLEIIDSGPGMLVSADLIASSISDNRSSALRLKAVTNGIAQSSQFQPM